MNKKIGKEDLVAAKAKHYFFKSKMRAFLEGSTEVPENILSDFNACGLGKWINEIGRQKYGAFPEIEELDSIHQRIHETAKEIILLKNKGQQEKAEKKMSEINKIGRYIVEKIEALEAQLPD